MQLVLHHQRLGLGTLVSLIVLISGCALAPDISDAPGTSEPGTSEPGISEPGTSDAQPRPATVISQLPADDLFYGAALGATKSIEAYLERSDVITSEGGSDPRRMASLVTPQWYPKEEEGFARFSAAQERTLGQTTVDGLQVQLARQVPGGGLDIGVIACVDATKVLVLGLEDGDPPAEVLQWQGEWESFDGTAEEWEVIEGFWATTSARWGQRNAVVFWLVGESTDELLVDHTEQWWGISRC